MEAEKKRDFVSVPQKCHGCIDLEEELSKCCNEDQYNTRVQNSWNEVE